MFLFFKNALFVNCINEDYSSDFSDILFTVLTYFEIINVIISIVLVDLFIIVIIFFMKTVNSWIQ